jgi:hypothetical protein
MTTTPGTEHDVCQALAETGIRPGSVRTLCERARASGSHTWYTGTHAYVITWDAEAGYQVTPSQDKDRRWTLAFRNPRANRFRRVTDWGGSWDEAQKMSGAAVTAHPELEIWYVPSLAAEQSGYSCEEDRGNILANTGRRVRMVDDAVLADVVPPGAQPAESRTS